MLKWQVRKPAIFNAELLCVPASNGVFDDLLGFVEAKEAFYHRGAWFFEVFVVVEVKLDLLNQLSGQIFQSLNGVAVVAVISWHSNDFVVNFVVIDKFHHTEHTSWDINAGGQWLRRRLHLGFEG